MSGGETAEPIAQFYMQNWADVGIKVQLLDGRLHEFNSFYDQVEADDPKIDIYQGAWGVGSDPNPSGLYGRTAAFNYTRYTSEKNDELLELFQAKSHWIQTTVLVSSKNGKSLWLMKFQLHQQYSVTT